MRWTRSAAALAAAVSWLALADGGPVRAAPISQYASTVIDKSSEYSAGAWSAAQALFAPNTFAYGDIGTAWAPRNANGNLEYLEVGFTTDVYADGFTVRETNGNGFVYQVDVLDTNNVLHTVWTGTDPSQPGSPADFSVDFARTGYLVQGLKVYVDSNHDLSTWEEIDAIQLRGDDTTPGNLAAVPVPGGMALTGIGTLSLLGYARRRRQATAA